MTASCAYACILVSAEPRRHAHGQKAQAWHEHALQLWARAFIECTALNPFTGLDWLQNITCRLDAQFSTTFLPEWSFALKDRTAIRALKATYLENPCQGALPEAHKLLIRQLDKCFAQGCQAGVDPDAFTAHLAAGNFSGLVKALVTCDIGLRVSQDVGNVSSA